MSNIKNISWNELTSQSLLYSSKLTTYFKNSNFNLVQRNHNPPQQFTIAGQNYQIQLPITFTPYAAAQPCSARCWFCSENLNFDNHRSSSSLKMIKDYHSLLSNALDKLIEIPLGLSLSGLEFSDNLEWAINTIHCLLQWENKGGLWTEKAAYSNLAGFSNAIKRDQLLDKLKLLNINRFEVSRHHYDEQKNNSIMKFRPTEKILKNSVFLEALFSVQFFFKTRLVCILQKDGINNLNKIYKYLTWSKKNNIKYVIFRELSDITDEHYIHNNTYRKIQLNKISIEPIITEILKESANSLWKPIHIETGYYYWNSMWETPWGTVIFERSDYGFMQIAHKSNILYKLIFHPNGNLCSDWTPNINILFGHPNV